MYYTPRMSGSIKVGRVSADLKKVQVIDLVPYQGDADDAFDVVPDGYSSEDEKIPFAS